MAVARCFGLQVPMLIDDYDPPYYANRDKIIAFAVSASAALFHAASQHRAVVRRAIAVLAIAVLGPAVVNLPDALASVLPAGQSTLPYWLQTGVSAIDLTVSIAC